MFRHLSFRNIKNENAFEYLINIYKGTTLLEPSSVGLSFINLNKFYLLILKLFYILNQARSLKYLVNIKTRALYATIVFFTHILFFQKSYFLDYLSNNK